MVEDQFVDSFVENPTRSCQNGTRQSRPSDPRPHRGLSGRWMDRWVCFKYNIDIGIHISYTYTEIHTNMCHGQITYVGWWPSIHFHSYLYTNPFQDSHSGMDDHKTETIIFLALSPLYPHLIPMCIAETPWMNKPSCTTW